MVNLWRNNGVYSGDYIENWVREKLLAKGVKRFKDLKRTLKIIASDITSGEMLVLPDDIIKYNKDPDSLEVAKAVRMSSSIPYFFRPVKIKSNYQGKKRANCIVDGGLLSNFPVWIFDNQQQPRWPTFGYRTVSKNTGKPNKIFGPFSLGFALISTMIEAHDMLHIKDTDFVRTIMVPSLGIKATNFHISKKESEELFISGVNAGKKFFDKWSFAQYIVEHRVTKKIII